MIAIDDNDNAFSEGNSLEFATSDLALAAAIGLQFPVFSIDMTNPKKAVFSFASEQDIQDMVDEFWAGKMRVDPKAYFAMLRELKARIYETR